MHIRVIRNEINLALHGGRVGGDVFHRGKMAVAIALAPISVHLISHTDSASLTPMLIWVTAPCLTCVRSTPSLVELDLDSGACEQSPVGMHASQCCLGRLASRVRLPASAV